MQDRTHGFELYSRTQPKLEIKHKFLTICRYKIYPRQLAGMVCVQNQAFQHCSSSMTFWYGSGSADPCLWQMDPDTDPAIFFIDLQEANKKLILKKFFCLLLFEGTLHHFTKIKSFSYYFCLMIEGSGSVPLTNGSGSRRPKNIRIRIRNTAFRFNILMRHPEWSIPIILPVENNAAASCYVVVSVRFGNAVPISLACVKTDIFANPAQNNMPRSCIVIKMVAGLTRPVRVLLPFSLYSARLITRDMV